MTIPESMDNLIGVLYNYTEVCKLYGLSSYFPMKQQSPYLQLFPGCSICMEMMSVVKVHASHIIQLYLYGSPFPAGSNSMYYNMSPGPIYTTYLYCGHDWDPTSCQRCP